MQTPHVIHNIEGILKTVKTIHTDEGGILPFVASLPPDAGLGFEAEDGEVSAWLCSLPGTVVFTNPDLNKSDLVIKVPIMQMGIVGTLPEYRHKGLATQICGRGFDERAIQKGCPIQLIAGIPHFYRHFGYEYACDLPWFADIVPAEKILTSEAVPTNTVKAERVNKEDSKAVSSWLKVREEVWQKYVGLCGDVTPEIMRDLDKSPKSIATSVFTAEWWLLKDKKSDQVIGSFALQMNWGRIIVKELCIANDHQQPQQQLTDAVTSALAAAVKMAKECKYEAGAIDVPLQSGVAQEVLRLINQTSFPRPYAWYVKINDFAGLIKRLQPALSERFARSKGVSSFAGRVVINTHQPGKSFALDFKGGKLESVTSIAPEKENIPFFATLVQAKPPEGMNEVLYIPPTAFAKVVLGHKTLESLVPDYPDLKVTAMAREIINCIFPKFPAMINFI